MKKLVMVVALAVGSSAYSMQRAPQKKMQAVPKAASKAVHKVPQPKTPQPALKAAQKVPQVSYYPPAKTLPQALWRIQQHSMILNNLEDLPDAEFAQKEQYSNSLKSISQILQLSQYALKRASKALPKEKLESAEALEAKALALFNQKMPQLFMDICELVTKKNNPPAAGRQQSAH